MNKTPMLLTGEAGTDFWNDSCDLSQLKEAIANGAVGATSNPVIVAQVAKGEIERWGTRIDAIARESPEAGEVDVAWKLIEEMAGEASKLLLPVFNRTGGRKGRLSVQVNPVNFRSWRLMLEQGMALSRTAPNLAIKAPCTEPGIKAMEEMTAKGVSVTATVSFTVSQAVASAEAIERGLDRAGAEGIDVTRMSPSVVIMLGRVDDHLKSVLTQRRINIDPGYLEWAGIAVLKKLYAMFTSRGYRSRLLGAAYRNHMQWSELVGGDLILTIPYKWWQQFNRADSEVGPKIDNPVDTKIVDGLRAAFPEFREAYDDNALSPGEFVRYGATVNTLDQFMSGYYELLTLVRSRMLAYPGKA